MCEQKLVCDYADICMICVSLFLYCRNRSRSAKKERKKYISIWGSFSTEWLDPDWLIDDPKKTFKKREENRGGIIRLGNFKDFKMNI